MSKVKYYNDDEAKKHDEYCYVIVIAPNVRTYYSCNCSRREIYRTEFKKSSQRKSQLT